MRIPPIPWSPPPTVMPWNAKEIFSKLPLISLKALVPAKPVCHIESIPLRTATIDEQRIESRVQCIFTDLINITGYLQWANSPWINKYRVVRQGAAEFEKRSISGIYEHFRRGGNTAWRPETPFIHGLLRAITCKSSEPSSSCLRSPRSVPALSVLSRRHQPSWTRS